LSFDNRIIWEQSRDALVAVIVSLGFPAELGEMIARHLGSPKGIDRMTAYLQYERPTDDRMIVDEMLAISEEIESWRKKKNSRASNAAWDDEYGTSRCITAKFVLKFEFSYF